MSDLLAKYPGLKNLKKDKWLTVKLKGHGPEHHGTYTVFIVDGTYMRNYVSVAFCGDAHPGMPYMGEFEFFIEKCFNEEDRRAFLVHSISEWSQMEYNDHKYIPAHRAGNQQWEAKFRREVYKVPAPYHDGDDLL